MNFDGVAASVKAPLGETFSVFGTAGAFPIFNTSLNFSSRDAGAFESKDRYLFGGQLGFEFSPSDSIRGRLAAGYFQFDGVQGEFSARSEEHTSGTPVTNAHLVCRLLLEKKKEDKINTRTQDTKDE